MVEVLEVLRGWLEGAGLRKVAERSGVGRKTARRFVAAAQAEGLTREAGLKALTDELIGAVVAAVRPARPDGHGASWELLLAHQEQITEWVAGGKGHDPLSIVKIEELGQPVHMTSARRLHEVLANDQIHIVVMLGNEADLTALVALAEWSIWWSANLGTGSEELVSGQVANVLADLVAARARARQAAGCLMDVYLLRAPA